MSQEVQPVVSVSAARQFAAALKAEVRPTLVRQSVWNIYRYATGILIVLILFRGGMVWWYLQVVLIL